MQKNTNVRFLVTSAVIAALYAALTVSLGAFAFGGIQFRVAEALTIMPLFTTAAIPGLTVGCAIANFIGVMLSLNSAGVADIFFGTFASFLAALLTYGLRNIRIKHLPLFSFLPPIIINMVVVGAQLWIIAGLPFWITALQVGAGQLAACVGLGFPLYITLRKNEIFNKVKVPGLISDKNQKK